MKTLERVSNESFFFISVSHSRFALLETFSNEFFGQYRDPRTANLGKSRDLVLVVTFAVCDSSFQKDTVLAVIDLRQRVIAIVVQINPTDLPAVWPYQSRCYICLLSIGNNFKYQI